MIHASIDIKPLLGNTLDSRDEAIKLFEYISNKYNSVSKISFNFDKVDFMSRSFADQFHKEKLNWAQNHSVIFEIENADIQIIEILQAVTRTQVNRKTKKDNTVAISFSKPEQLFEYLMAL